MDRGQEDIYAITGERTRWRTIYLNKLPRGFGSQDMLLATKGVDPQNKYLKSVVHIKYFPMSNFFLKCVTLILQCKLSLGEHPCGKDVLCMCFQMCGNNFMIK